jgi:hypothetical protein
MALVYLFITLEYNLNSMKQVMRFLLPGTVSCLISCLLFGQDSTKVYTVNFSGLKTNLSKEAKATLANVANVMRTQPNWHFAIMNCMPGENQRFNQANWDRMEHLVNHLVKKEGINSERLVFIYSGAIEDCNTVNLQYTPDTILTAPPPHPSLRRKN